MNRLLMDFGNSCLKWVLVDGVVDLDKCFSIDRHCYTDHSLKKVLDDNKGKWRLVDEVWISCVLAESQRAFIESWFIALGVTAVHFAFTQKQCCGVHCGYEQPAELGVDRWLALLAANPLAKGNKLVVDLGTAITVDLLTSTGQHLGGLIAPGAEVMMRSLTDSTALQGVQLLERPLDHATWGKSTEDGLQLGVQGMIEGLLRRSIILAEAQLGTEDSLTVVLTGGYADRFNGSADQLQSVLLFRPDLVLMGLWCRSQTEVT